MTIRRKETFKKIMFASRAKYLTNVFPKIGSLRIFSWIKHKQKLYSNRKIYLDFDPHQYLQRYCDVRVAKLEPFEHFLYYGRNEGRSPCTLRIFDVPMVFHCATCRKNYLKQVEFFYKHKNFFRLAEHVQQEFILLLIKFMNFMPHKNYRLIFTLSNISRAVASDGYIKRVLETDENLFNGKRIYINFNSNNHTISCVKINEYILEINLNKNILFSLDFIDFILKESRIVFFHAIETKTSRKVLEKSMLYNKKIIWDVHGAQPEEEELKLSLSPKSAINDIKDISETQRLFAKECTVLICVSNALLAYLMNKYPNFKIQRKSLVRYISGNLRPSYSLDRFRSISKFFTYHIKWFKFVYSGNLAPWQNVDQMLHYYNELHTKGTFFFFTSDIEKLRKLFKILNIKKTFSVSRIRLKDISNKKLLKNLFNFHFGFVLRENNIINNVAFPTKLREYLDNGILPVLLEPFGDFDSMGMKYLLIDDLTKYKYPNFNEFKTMIASNKTLSLNLSTHNKNVDKNLSGIINEE